MLMFVWNFQCKNRIIIKSIFSLLLLIGISMGILVKNVNAAQENYLNSKGYVEVIYNLKNGINTDATNCIVQTKEGFIWIGSYNGLTRYDGADFYNISPAESGINSVASLWVDKKDQLWIGTNGNGIALYKQGKYSFWDRNKGLQANTVRAITENDDGVIFVGTTQGLSFLKDGKIVQENDVHLKDKYIAKLTKLKNNKVFGITKKGELFVYKGQKLESFCLVQDVALGDILSVEEDKLAEDKYWVGTNRNKIARISLSGNTLVIEKLLEANGNSSINSIHQFKDGSLLFASDNGVGLFDSKDSLHRFTGMSFNNSIDNIMVDYEENIWLTSSRQGVAKLTKNRFGNVFAEVGLTPAVVNAVLEYKGALYIASDSGLEVVKDGKRDLEHPLVNILKGERVRNLLEDSKGNLWVSTYSAKGLIKYNKVDGISVFNKQNGLVSSRVRVAIEDKNGIIYVGTRDGLSIIRDDKIVKNLTVKDGLANSQVLCLLEHNGKIYAGTDGGGISVLERYSIVDNIDEASGLPNGVILRMATDSNGKGMWISTSASLAYYEAGKIENIKGFPNANNFDLIFLKDGKVLVTCNKGIYVTSSQKLKDNGGYDLLLTYKEGISSSLTANSFNYLDDKGNLYLCLQSGVDRLDVNKMFDSGANLKLCVPYIVLDGVKHYFDSSKSIEIPGSVDKISFKGYLLSNKLDDAFLSVQLEGYDKEPVVFSRFNNREFTYTNLNGGKYKIHIGVYDPRTGKINSDIVYTLIKGSKLVDYSPLLLVCVLFGGGALFAGYRYYMGRKVASALRKQEETEKFLDEVINAFANAIDLKDHYTKGHSDRVAEYSKLLALAMGLSKEKADSIFKIGKLHDVGKVIVPITILTKKGRLTKEEYEEMKKHTDAGAEILEAIKSYPSIAVGAATHHERYDGKGYSHNLTGKDIPLEGRIIAVADTFDAMNSTRVYRPHLSREVILQELHNARGTQLDPDIVDILLKLIDKGKIVITEVDDIDETTLL